MRLKKILDTNFKIAILLSTYNGDTYLNEQLDSLLSQTYKNFEILARDDGSSDNTLEILNSYNIRIIDSKKNLGVKSSFALLLKYAVENSDADYFMFCDQDDVWKSDKIEKTLLKMQEIEQEFGIIPLLVHTDLKVVDERLEFISDSFISYQNLNAQISNFSRLLMQNNITGCTMMLNKELAKICLPIPVECMMHDWWIGLVASKFGKIGYIDEATIKYRQHETNTIGAKGFDLSCILNNISKKARLDRNISQAKVFLKQFKSEPDLNDETAKMLQEFTTLEQKTWLQKRILLWRYKLFKQGFIRNVGLFLKI